MLSHAFSKGQYFSGPCAVILSYLVISLPHMGRFFLTLDDHLTLALMRISLQLHPFQGI